MSSDLSVFKFGILDLQSIIKSIKEIDLNDAVGPFMRVMVDQRFRGYLPDDLKRFFIFIQDTQEKIDSVKNLFLSDIVAAALKNVKGDVRKALAGIESSSEEVKKEVRQQEDVLAFLGRVFMAEVRLFFKIDKSKEVVITSHWEVFF